MQRLFHSRSKELYTRGKNLHTNLANSCKYPLVTQPHQDNRSRVLNQNHLSRDPNMSRDPIVMTYHAQNLSRVKTLFLASAHHPTQKQTKSPSIGIKFVLFATNRRLEALWQSNKLLCSIKWKTRAAAAWKTTEFNDVKETVDEQRWSRNTKTPVVTRLLTRSTTNPKTATINSDFWHDELGDPMTVQRPDHGEPMHRKLEKWGGNISQGSFLDQKSLTRMTTLLVSANACKDETLKRNWFYFIPWGSQLFNLNIPQYTYDAPILTDG